MKTGLITKSAEKLQTRVENLAKEIEKNRLNIYKKTECMWVSKSDRQRCEFWIGNIKIKHA